MLEHQVQRFGTSPRRGLCILLLVSVCGMGASSKQSLEQTALREAIPIWESGSRRLDSLDANSGDPIAVDLPSRFQPKPLELTARDAVDTLLPDRPQESDIVAGITTIHLPDGGRLLRYRAAGAGTGGILHVGPMGQPSELLSLPLADGKLALTRFVAVSEWSQQAVVLSNRERTGRGDLYLLRWDQDSLLAGETRAELVTASMSDPDPVAESMTFTHNAFFFSDSTTQLFRLDLADRTMQEVDLPPSADLDPVHVGNELAVSADGSTLAALAGQSPTMRDLYVIDPAGKAFNLTESAGEYFDVGHTTSDPTGPRLSLSPDGSRVTFIKNELHPEVFSRQTVAGTAESHVTSSQHFAAWIDDGSSIITGASSVFLTIGDSASAQDAYRVSFAEDSVASIVNLTHTSLDPDGAPWQHGATLEPVFVGRVNSEADVCLVSQDGAGSGQFELWLLEDDSGTLHWEGLQTVPSALIVGEELIVAGEDAAGPRIGRWRTDATELEWLFQAAPGTAIRSVIRDQHQEQLAFVASAGAEAEVIGKLALETGQLELVTGVPGAVGGQLHYGRDGQLIFAFGSEGEFGVFVQNQAGLRLLDVFVGCLWFL